MEAKEKQLLITDLSTRVLYGVIISPADSSNAILIGCLTDGVLLQDVKTGRKYEKPWELEYIKPYLRPISSMTDKEVDTLFDILHIDKDGKDEDWIKINNSTGIKFFLTTGKWIEDISLVFDYLNSIHIDYRGLIEKGLALEAPEDMYK